MLEVRAIPVLLMSGEGFYKTKKFKRPIYLGDPINILRIFNEKEVDEILILDITTTLEKKEPNYRILGEMSSECFMPLSYGGGLDSIEKIGRILSCGFEKVCINTAIHNNPELISEAAAIYGSQSIIISIDVKKNLFGKYDIYTKCGKKKVHSKLVDFLKRCENSGAGELIINSIDHDGMMNGYDVELLKQASTSVNIPVIACGGAGNVEHMREAVVKGGASAVAAGSMFVFQGPRRAVLINVPHRQEFNEIFSKLED